MKESTKQKVIEELEKGHKVSEIAEIIEVSVPALRYRMKHEDLEWYEEATKPKYRRKQEKIAEEEKKSKKIRVIILSESISLPEKKKITIDFRIRNPTISKIMEKAKINSKIDTELSIKVVDYFCNFFLKNQIDCKLPIKCISAASVYVQSLHKEGFITQLEACNLFNCSGPSLRKLFKIVKITPKKLNELILNQ